MRRRAFELISTMYRPIATASLALLVVFVLGVVAFQGARAQTSTDSALHSFTVLHKFTGGADGASPNGVILDATGNLYGTTVYSGNMSGCQGSGCGTVFKLNATGKEKKLHTFTGGADGGIPGWNWHLVQDAKGNTYGTTIEGGNLSCPSMQYGCGVVFRVDRTGKYEVLYAFQGGNDGAGPEGAVVLDAKSNLYGTTYYGGTGACDDGTGANCGTVFKLDTSGKETVLYSFTGDSDGAYPVGNLVLDAAGNLYGATAPYHSGEGTVFELNTKTQKLTTLYSFTGAADGASPAGSLLYAKGNLYGSTYGGGADGYGVVFKLNVKTQTETVLYTFTGNTDGSTPNGGLIMDAKGLLYGTTQWAGNLNCFSGLGCGVVFKLSKGGKQTVLHTFTLKADGGIPVNGVVQDANGNLYGTTGYGGKLSCNAPYGCGVVFKLTP
jgi:uncharacterized repeat protein (TIGR03803 family)